MNGQDERSVGELLLDAEFISRQILMDVTGEDAPAMLRTWGEVVQSAAELWTTSRGRCKVPPAPSTAPPCSAWTQ